MCRVYAATHTLTGKRVALKVLREQHLGDSRLRARFVREARAACAVRHPNVLEIDDVLELPGGAMVLVMDRLEGESLAHVFARERRVPIAELAAVMVDVVDAVGAAHALGIVHRDLKPDNIFLQRGVPPAMRVKVLDFGIAKLTATEGEAARHETATKKGAMLGTPCYMAPEQVFGDEDLDHRADIWALGVILYEGLAGVRPTEGDSAAQIFMRIVRGAIEPIERRVPDLPPDVTALIGSMLSPDRDQRPEGTGEVLRVLARYATSQPLALSRPSAPGSEWEPQLHATRLPRIDRSQPPLSVSTRPVAPASGMARWARTALPASFLIALFAGIGLFVRGAHPRADASPSRPAPAWTGAEAVHGPSSLPAAAAPDPAPVRAAAIAIDVPPASPPRAPVGLDSTRRPAAALQAPAPKSAKSTNPTPVPSVPSASPVPKPPIGIARKLDRDIPWEQPRLDARDPRENSRDE
jgi:serine/threonine-protein kinase